MDPRFVDLDTQANAKKKLPCKKYTQFDVTVDGRIERHVTVFIRETMGATPLQYADSMALWACMLPCRSVTYTPLNIMSDLTSCTLSCLTTVSGIALKMSFRDRRG
jgi:hypothetical protein